MRDELPPVRRRALRVQLGLDYWIAGFLSSKHRRLLDALNKEQADFLVVENAVLRAQSPDGRPIKSRLADDRLPFANVRVGGILLVVPGEEAATPPPDGQGATERRREQVLLGVGPYAVSGQIVLAAGAPGQDVASGIAGPFFAVSAAEVTPIGGSGYTETFPVVFVNRAKMDFVVPVGTLRASVEACEENAGLLVREVSARGGW